MAIPVRPHIDDIDDIENEAADDDLLGRIAARPLPDWRRGELPAPDVEAAGRRSRPRADARRAPWRHRLAERLAVLAARTGVTPRAVVGLLLLGTVIAGVLVVRLVLVEHGSRPVPLRMAAATASGDPSAAVAEPSISATTAVATADATDAAGGIVLVHVVGQVRHPGVVRLPAGSRVEQALEAAGGATATADLVRVNLARPVVDGEQIVVPKPGQPIEGAAGVFGGPGTSGVATRAPLVDLNTADLTELDSLPGVGPVLAQRILDWRSQNGRFSTVDELGEVSGIGDKVLENLRPLVRV
jgi:competence protein ComEA